MAGLRIRLFSFSRTRSLHSRMWRRMSYSSGLAWSLISSSERIASNTASSSGRLGSRFEAIARMCGVSSRSVTSALLTPRAARSASAMLSSALAESVEPMDARLSGSRTSAKDSMGLPPV